MLQYAQYYKPVADSSAKYIVIMLTCIHCGLKHEYASIVDYTFYFPNSGVFRIGRRWGARQGDLGDMKVPQWDPGAKAPSCRKLGTKIRPTSFVLSATSVLMYYAVVNVPYTIKSSF